jgi:hypothetical protein
LKEINFNAAKLEELFQQCSNLLMAVVSLSYNCWPN